jgi:hypothetical protein
VIEKFNFYDIYGYFLPGLILIGVLWLPFGLVRNEWPPTDWSTAVIAAGVAYVFGHLMQMVAAEAIPSTKGAGRFFGVALLDQESKLLSEVKIKLRALIQNQFGIDIEPNQPIDKERDNRRNTAFYLARQALVVGNAAKYAEQFEGMYSWERGLVATLSIACAYWLGWAAGVIRSDWLLKAAILLLGISMWSLFNTFAPTFPEHLHKTIRAWSLLAIALSIGSCEAHTGYVTSRQAGLFLFLAILALAASIRAYDAYRSFAETFATSIWRDYVAFSAKATGGHDESNKVL